MAERPQAVRARPSAAQPPLALDAELVEQLVGAVGALRQRAEVRDEQRVVVLLVELLLVRRVVEGGEARAERLDLAEELVVGRHVARVDGGQVLAHDVDAVGEHLDRRVLRAQVLRQRRPRVRVAARQDVGDVVDVNLWFLDNPEISGIFNLGTGQARSFDDMAGAIFDAMQKPRDVVYFDMPENVRNQYQYFTEARIDRLRAAGYDRPFTSLEEGVRSYVRSFLETNDPYV